MLGLNLSAPLGTANFAYPSNATVTILNTNIGIAFVSATNSFTEPSGQQPGTVVLNVVRFNNTNATTTVYYSTTNGTAIAGTNFVGVTNNSLTFNPGDSIKPITITTLYDANPLQNGVLPPSWSFTVGLALLTNSGAQLTQPSTTTVTDYDVNAGLRFVFAAEDVLKTQPFKTLYVFCSNTNQEPLYVNYNTSPLTAVPGVDYTTTSGTLAFTNGTIIQSFNVAILPNTLVQSNKTFSVILSNPTGTGILEDPSTEIITIVNTNTPYGLSFSSPVVINGGWGTATIDNTQSFPELGDPPITGTAASAPVWFTWTAPSSGEVEMDTIGSMATNGVQLDTLLGVFTGKTLNTLNQIAANDDLYPNIPQTQINLVAENTCNTNNYGANLNGNAWGMASGPSAPLEGQIMMFFNHLPDPAVCVSTPLPGRLILSKPIQNRA